MSELIEMSLVSINDKQITIMCDHTSFFNELFVEKIDIAELLNQYKVLIKQAKACNVSISYKNRYKTILTNIKPLYELAYRNYKTDFLELKKLATKKMEKGIYSGYCDDKELDEMFEIRNRMMASFYRSEPMSRVREISNSLADLSRNVGEYAKITL